MSANDETTEIANNQCVGISNGAIVVIAPVVKMTKREALMHAAWIVALAETEDGEFAAILEAVQRL